MVTLNTTMTKMSSCFNLLAQKDGNYAGDEKNNDQRVQEQVQQFKCEQIRGGSKRDRWVRT